MPPVYAKDRRNLLKFLVANSSAIVILSDFLHQILVLTGKLGAISAAQTCMRKMLSKPNTLEDFFV